MTENSTATGIGASVRRKEDFRFITGSGRYTDDINLPGQSYAVFVRSPHAHARIQSIDVTEAMASPGVIAVYAGEDLKADGIGDLICGWMIHSKDGSEMKVGPHPPLAVGIVRYVGEPLAIVIGETYNAAQDGAERVHIDYEELAAVVDVGSTQSAGAPRIHEVAPNNTVFEWELGDKTATDAAFAQAPQVIKLDIRNNRLIPNAIEPRSAIGSYDVGTDQFTLYVTSQNPHLARLVLSAFVGLAPEHKLRVVSPDVGGGFGSKIAIYSEETVCTWASKKVKRPVKWTAERVESFLCDTHGRDHVSQAELALDDTGKILGLRVKTIANLGAYLSTFSSCVPTYLYGTLLSGQYDIPHIYVEVDGVYTNTTPLDAYRGAGRPEAAFLIERLMELAARRLGIAPPELRRRNFIKSFPHQTPVILTYDIGDYEASLDKALALIDYDGFAARRRDAEQRGNKRGIGFSTYVEACGLAPSQAVGSLGAGIGLWESAEVRVNPTGNVEVLSGCQSNGQGHETTYAQLVSQRLGIPIDDVKVIQGDTAQVQFGMGTYGSRSASVGLSAVSIACDKVVAKAKKIAAHLLEAGENDVDFKDGIFTAKGTNKSLTFPEVALAAYMAHHFPTDEIEPGLKETAFYDPVNFTFPAGCHICEVEIDPETGITRIEKFVAVDDFGTIINPMIVEGQVHGGLTQGIGQAMFEECIYDSESGQLVTGSYMDYCLPRADDVPSYDIAMTKTECPSNPLGVKGCGEAGAIGATPAVINAITDALNIDTLQMPATPERVWRAARSNR